MWSISILLCVWFVLVGLTVWVHLKYRLQRVRLDSVLDHDIDELKASWQKHVEHMAQREKVLGAIFEGGMDGWWDWRVQDGIEEYSTKFREILGYEGEEDFPSLPESWQKAIHSEDLPRVLDLFKKHVESHGKIPFKLYVRYHTKDGETVLILCRGRVIEWDGDEPVRAVGTHTDVTGLIEAFDE